MVTYSSTSAAVHVRTFVLHVSHGLPEGERDDARHPQALQNHLDG
jgi:hypothetical protein